jgi:hypothetical protein
MACGSAAAPLKSDFVSLVLALFFKRFPSKAAVNAGPLLPRPAMVLLRTIQTIANLAVNQPDWSFL